MSEVMFRKEHRKFTYTHDFEPYGVELPPAIDAESRLLYTGQERDTHTNFDYMHFRFYASSMGRFLKPDNLIGNISNPQSWNLYSYVNGNPVNFYDPLGHWSNVGSDSTYMMNTSGASWMNWGAYTSFYSSVYGGNVALQAHGAGGGGGSSSQTYTYVVGKWVLTGWFDMWITQDEPPYDMETYPKKAIWTYESYTVQGEIDLTPYLAELDRGEIIPRDLLKYTKIVGYIGQWRETGEMQKSRAPEGWLYQFELIGILTKFTFGNRMGVAQQEIAFPQGHKVWSPAKDPRFLGNPFELLNIKETNLGEPLTWPSTFIKWLR